MAQSERQILERLITKKMDITPDAQGSSEIVKDMSLDQLKNLANKLKGWGGKSGGIVSKRAKGGVTNFKGHF